MSSKIHRLTLDEVIIIYPHLEFKKLQYFSYVNYRGLATIINSEEFINTVSEYLRVCTDIKNGDIIEYDFINLSYYGGHCWYNKIVPEHHHEIPEVYYPKFPLSYMPKRHYFSYVWLEFNSLQVLNIINENGNYYLSIPEGEKTYKIMINSNWKTHQVTNKDGVKVIQGRIEN